MDHNYIAEELLRNRKVFESLLGGVPKDHQRWKPAQDKWCLLEILCHLFDEEREDFRIRTRLVLDNPRQDLPKIDPVSWVADRAYMERDYEEMLEKFLEERAISVGWLKGLETPDWTKAHHHPILGEMSAVKFLNNWLAHDYLHLRQIAKLKYDYLRVHSSQDLDYAGNW